MNDQLENENENGSRVWSISCATSWWQSSLALGPLLRPYSQSCGGHRPRTLHEHSWGLECLKDKLPQRWFDGKNLFPHLVQDNIPKFGKRLPLPFMVGSPTSQTHTKKKKTGEIWSCRSDVETFASAPPARKAWSHVLPRFCADPRTGIRLAIHPTGTSSKKTHLSATKASRSLDSSAKFFSNHGQTILTPQTSYGGLSSPTISLSYASVLAERTNRNLNLELHSNFSLLKDQK